MEASGNTVRSLVGETINQLPGFWNWSMGHFHWIGMLTRQSNVLFQGPCSKFLSGGAKLDEIFFFFGGGGGGVGGMRGNFYLISLK